MRRMWLDLEGGKLITHLHVHLADHIPPIHGTTIHPVLELETVDQNSHTHLRPSHFSLSHPPPPSPSHHHLFQNNCISLFTILPPLFLLLLSNIFPCCSNRDLCKMEIKPCYSCKSLPTALNRNVNAFLLPTRPCMVWALPTPPPHLTWCHSPSHSLNSWLLRHTKSLTSWDLCWCREWPFFVLHG